MKNTQAHRKALVLLTAGLALAAQSPAASLPTVYRATASVYASVPYPASIAFAADGAMYVGNDSSGTVKIHRVGPGGTPVEEYGRTGIPDPDAVAVDRTGAISGFPGAVLVGGGAGASVPGYVKAIIPGGLVTDLFNGISSFPNINAFTYDRSGRLLAVDYSSGYWGVVTSTAVTPLEYVAAYGSHIAADASNRVVVSTTADTRLRLFAPNGTFIQYLNVGASPGSPLAAANSSFWGTNVYLLDTSGRLLSLDLAGNTTIKGSGFQGAEDMQFGEDGSLYLCDYINDRIIKITPDGGPTANVQLSCVDICWNSLSNYTYQVQYRSDLTTNQWVNLGATLPGTGSDMCITDTIKNQPKKFYRVVETP